jgi:signal transduction histidine kinase
LKKIHPLLEQQLVALSAESKQSEEIQSFIETVNEAYSKFDRDRELIQHSHRLSDLEFIEINKRLNESTDRLSLATKAASMGVWEWSGITGNIMWDDLMYEIFGVTNRDSFGKISANWHKLIHPEDAMRIGSKLAFLDVEEPVKHFEFRIIRPSDNAICYIATSTFLSLDTKGFPVRIVGICIDVTNLRLAEQEKAKLLENVLKQNKELEDFAFVISHRLRSHSSKLSTVSSVFKNPAVNDLLRNQLIDEVEKEAQLLDETLRDLTEIIAVGDSKKVEAEWLNVLDVVNASIDSLQPAMEQHKVVIHVDVTNQLQIFGVRSYLENVVFQLLHNALKFRNVERQLEIKISAEESADALKLSFADNGIGIDLERHHNKLFGLYRKFHTHIEGKGIGLHLAKKQLELMDGKIEVESVLNEGTQFTLYLKKV